MAQIEKETDVLVIGGGLAGCLAAIQARSIAPRVMMVDKAVISRSGASAWAYYLLAPPENMNVWKKELVEKGDYLNDQDWVDVLLQEHGRRIADMVEWGVPFERDEKGNLIKKAGRGHDRTRFVTSDGRNRMEALKRKAKDAGVEIVERVMCTDLLTSDGRHPTSGSVIGAIGFNTMTGDTAIFKSKAVVIASGPLSPKSNLSGDGTVMAFRAGAEVTGMEFCTHPTCFMTDGKRNLGSLNVLFQSLGLRLVNNRGERFMEKYSPALMERSDWAVLAQAIVKETFDGRGPVLLDMSAARDEDIAFFARLHPGRMSPFLETGIDLKRGRIMVEPWVSVSSSSGDGGIRIDTHGGTNIPGLFAAGSACKNGVHGTYSVGGINLAFCCSSGYRAGESAARYSERQRRNALLPRRQLRSLQQDFFSRLGQKNTSPATALVSKIEKAVSPAPVSIIKREDRIRGTLDELERLNREVKAAGAKDIHELVKLREVDNFLFLADLTFRSALERKESRHSHYRQEYPYRDDLDWLKWVVIKNTADRGVETRAEPLAMERYTVKPAVRQRIPSRIAFP